MHEADRGQVLAPGAVTPPRPKTMPASPPPSSGRRPLDHVVLGPSDRLVVAVPEQAHPDDIEAFRDRLREQYGERVLIVVGANGVHGVQAEASKQLRDEGYREAIAALRNLGAIAAWRQERRRLGQPFEGDGVIEYMESRLSGQREDTDVR